MQTLSDSASSSKSVLNRVVGSVVILCVLLAAGLLLPKAVSLMLFPPSEKGNCFFLSDTECVSLSRQEIERLFLVDLDEDVEVLESHTSHGFNFNRQSARLRIQRGDPDRVLTEYGFDEIRALPADRASEAGISTLQEILVSPIIPRTATTTAFIGLNTKDEMLVYLLKEW